MVARGVWVELTAGNIRNSHIYLRDVLSFFPADAVGGSNVSSASPHTITVQFTPGAKVNTDIDGEKLFLRERKAVRDFFEQAGAKSGDRVIIERESERHYRFELKGS